MISSQKASSWRLLVAPRKRNNSQEIWGYSNTIRSKSVCIDDMSSYQLAQASISWRRPPRWSVTTYISSHISTRLLSKSSGEISIVSKKSWLLMYWNRQPISFTHSAYHKECQIYFLFGNNIMLRLQQILASYPPGLQQFPRSILREYLQVKILHFLFRHPSSSKMCFIGWTALRLIHRSQRFSEDLDFYNRGLTQSEFEDCADHIKRDLELEWCQVEIKIVYKWAFCCAVKLPGILYDNHLADMETEKLIIKIDTTPQWVDYDIATSLFQQFEHSMTMRTAPLDILMAMKWRALFGRVKGRDLFDLAFLIGMGVKTHRGYCSQTLWIHDGHQLKEQVLARLTSFDLDALHADVAPFLFDPRNESIKYFADIIAQTEF